ncbi:TolC family protein [Seonamhaeicola sediminis]|uniref:TolC family protein n=1 Tax=Seonamhaeicola sediminis TaxID=2528206 RepID=A0A562YFS6_9FLAO|nr:TolC family protein [Seonamhaeicola sediminis]TWO33448.1 TolC family protein [Seonamhaeicola sediminis]
MKVRFIFFSISLIHSICLFSQEIITPKEAISLALEHNYGIKIANNQVEVAKNNANILNSGYLPTLTGNANASIDRQNTEGQLANGDTRVATGAETRRYNASINLNYVLFDGLGRSYNYKQLKESQQLTELQARETIENTILQLFTVYYNVAELEENTNSIIQALEISRDRVVRAKYQFDYGQETKLALLNAEVDINNDSINLMNAEQQLKNFKRDLNLVLGNTLPDNFDIDTEVEFNQLMNKAELLEKAKVYNTALQQIEKNIKINSLIVKSEKSAYLPTVGLTGSYGWNESNNNSPLAFVLQNTNSGFSGGLNLTWNLFDGGNTITRVKNAKINLETQNIQKEEFLVTLERDFNNAWEDYQNKLAIFRLQEDNIKTSQNNFDRTHEKFKLGQLNSIEFRQAQINLLRATLTKNQAKYAAKIAELQLLKISGEILNVDF